MYKNDAKSLLARLKADGNVFIVIKLSSVAFGADTELSGTCMEDLFNIYFRI